VYIQNSLFTQVHQVLNRTEPFIQRKKLQITFGISDCVGMSVEQLTECKRKQVMYLRNHICLKSPRIDSEKSIPPTYVAWKAGTTHRAVVPARQAGNRFLGSLKCLKIRTLLINSRVQRGAVLLKLGRKVCPTSVRGGGGARTPGSDIKWALSQTRGTRNGQ
jgi:hypothetical protein